MKIINFPSQSQINNEFEDAEAQYYFLENKDYKGLLKFNLERAAKYPDDPYAQYYLCEAYIYNKHYIKAIEILTECHNKYPENSDFQYLILKALFALGKNENDFKWKEKPIIFNLNKTFLAKCYNYLKPKRKARSIADIYCHFYLKGYMNFTEEELLKVILTDKRFIVTDKDLNQFAKVKIFRNIKKT